MKLVLKNLVGLHHLILCNFAASPLKLRPLSTAQLHLKVLPQLL